MKAKTGVVGIILDGVGVRESAEGNPMKVAKMPFFNALLKEYPHTKIFASEEYVGLPKGQMGNSEVGHINLGAGRIVYQDFMRINNAIKDKTLDINPVLDSVFERVVTNKTTLHLAGLVSNGGVHSSIEHLKYLLKMAVRAGVKNIKVHCFTDGRDTKPDSGQHFVQEIEVEMGKLGVGQIATIVGRFYAMDREERWNRTQVAFDLITNGVGTRTSSIYEAFKKTYARNVSDEFMPPFVIGDYEGMKDGDEIFFFNFRPDRMRQISSAFATKNFLCFPRKNMPKIRATAMCMYDEMQQNLPYVFGPEVPKNTLSERLSKLGFKQLKIAETTKYAHVTYYFNGGVEKTYRGEKRILIESKFVDNFADYPVMRAPEIANVAKDEFEKKSYDFVLINFSNGDMVGHTGNFDACVKALEALDEALEKTVTSAIKSGYTCIITADHGNIEDMRVENGTSTTHTLNPVPFILTDKTRKLKQGKFALDCFAPTVLQLMEVYQPAEMTGKSLIAGDMQYD